MSGHGTDRGDDWDDARIDAAYRALAAGASSTGLPEAVTAAIRTPVERTHAADGVDDGPMPILEEVGGVTRRLPSIRADHRSRPLGAWLAVVAVLAIVAVAVGLGVAGRSPAIGPGGLRHYAVQGISFDYPASWSIHDQLPPTTGFGSTWAILGTHAWPASCGASDINCYYQATLEPGTIAVFIGIVSIGTDVNLCTLGATASDLQGRGPDDPVAHRVLLRIDGRPAFKTTYDVAGKDYYLSDEWIHWDIAPIGTVDEAYTIETMVRGPGTDALLADLDRLISSIRLTPSPGAQPPDDCGAPFPPIGATSPVPSTAAAPSASPALLSPAPSPTPATFMPPPRTPAPAPSGATELALATEPPAGPFPSGAVLGCDQALLGPIRVVGARDSVIFVSVDTGRAVDVVWPRGFAAYIVDGHAELVAPDGTIIAREGEVLSGLGGGLSASGDPFHICSVNGAMYGPAS